MLAIDPRRQPTRLVRSLSDAHDRIGPPLPGPAVAELRRCQHRAAAATVPRPAPRRDDPGLPIGDWELLFNAAMTRLHGLADSATASGLPRGAAQLSPGATGSLHDDLLYCAAALDQLHAAITRERASCHQRMAALFDDEPGIAGHPAATRLRTATLGSLATPAACAPCPVCAARQPLD